MAAASSKLSKNLPKWSSPNSKRAANRSLAGPVGLWHRVLQMANAKLLQRITIEPGKCGGRPCIRGLRMRVADVLHLLSAGASFDEILTDYPFLEREDILAAIEYAAIQTEHIVLQSA
jgi:uncharacterized protein (DUF433 family)